jgi:secreted trypsin-like serine protease
VSFRTWRALIAPTWVLTAAHCVLDDSNGDTLQPGVSVVGLGSGSSPTEVIPVARSVVHPRWTSVNQGFQFLFDLALIELANPAVTPPVKVLGPTESALAGAGAEGVVVGFGTTVAVDRGSDPRASFPAVAHVGQQRVVDASVEGFTRSTAAYVDAYAVLTDASRSSSCFGDSGGPFIVNAPDGPRVAGNVSGGVSCRVPGANANLLPRSSAHLGWISTVTNSTVSVGGAVRTGRLTTSAPIRVLDTRRGLGSNGKAGWTTPVRLNVSATTGAGATAVALNVTATEASDGTLVAVNSCESTITTVDQLLAPPNANVANLLVVPVAADGTVCLRSSSPSHLVADITGWFGPSGANGVAPITPVRIVDTRATTKVKAGTTLVVPVGSSVPTNATGIVATLTNTEPSNPGYLTVWPCDQARPEASNLNYAKGQTVPNTVITPMAADRSICVFSFADTHVIVDVSAAVGPSIGGGYTTVGDLLTFDSNQLLGSSSLSIPAGGRSVIRARSVAPVPASATAVALTLSAYSDGAAGFLTVYPCDQTQPLASNMNLAADGAAASTVVVPLAADGTVCVFNQSAGGLTASITGYFAA